jgi:hypothetical protein
VADAGLTRPDQDSAAHRVIGAYLAELAHRLGGPPAARAAIVAELEDGLWAATAAHQSAGPPPEAAARAAVAEFGDPTTVAAGFGPELAAATGRRVGLGLLSTGPLVGTGWLLVVAASWTRAGREPPPALGVIATLVGLVLAVAIPAAVLSVAASGRLSSWLPAGPRVAATAAATAASACVAGDLVLLAGLVAATCSPAGWPGRPGCWPRGRAARGSAWPAGRHAAAWPPGHH